MSKTIHVLVISAISGLKQALSSLSQKSFQNKAGQTFLLKFHFYSEEFDQDQTTDLPSIWIAEPNLLARLPPQHFCQVKWIQSTFAGVNSFVSFLQTNQMTESSFILTKLGGIFPKAMSEYVIAHIISWERKSWTFYEQQKNKKWAKDSYTYRCLDTLTLGIIGLGDIGTEIAKKAKVFGMKVVGFKKNTSEYPREYVDEVFDSVEKVIPQSDYIVNILPSTKETSHILDNVFSSLSHTPNFKDRKRVFINIGRGDVISSEELLEALEQNWLSGAIVDVFENEPLDHSSPLWLHPGVIITPHVSGVSRPEDLLEVFQLNFNHYINQESLEFIVDVQKGY